MSLRSTLTNLTLLVTVLAVLVAGALVILTTILHRTSTAIGASVESIRLAEEAAIDLLLHERAKDSLVQRDIEGSLRRKLAQAQQFVTTEDEARILAEAESSVEAYVIAARHPAGTTVERVARQAMAYDALQALVSINLTQSRSAQQEAAWWDHLANALGVAISVLLVLVAGALLLWLKNHAFEPILGLAAAMERFGGGDRDARATEQGPRELRDMCGRFNEMASAIAAQRQAQVAFLGGVAHDLRNPLSVMRLAVTVLRSDGPRATNDDIQPTVQRLGRCITQMERMLGDFLDIAKIEAGMLELRFETQDARKLVEHVVEQFEAISRERHIEVRLPDTAVPIHCDSLRVEQVITNVISNAIKYSPAESTVEVVLRSAGRELELSIVDRGVGILEEDQERVFEPFRRVGLSKETVPGVGLGLFVVRKLVEAHGGRIEVESRLGVGSTFRILLPMQATGEICE